MKREVEILAPAGSWECLEAAVCAGADAIYIGGSRFGARAHADNLNEERMLEAIDYVHLHGRKLYMTVNTLLKEQELGELGRLAQTDRQHARRQWIQRTGVSSLGRVIDTLDLLQCIIGRNAAGLGQQQDAVYITAFEATSSRHL